SERSHLAQDVAHASSLRAAHHPRYSSIERRVGPVQLPDEANLVVRHAHRRENIRRCQLSALKPSNVDSTVQCFANPKRVWLNPTLADKSPVAAARPLPRYGAPTRSLAVLWRVCQGDESGGTLARK